MISEFGIKIKLGFLSLIVFPLVGFAQIVELSSFTTLSDNKKVFLSWVLTAGSTCNGMKVFRGLDTINFVEVGDISGVCGSSSGPVGYDFTDESPPIGQTIYYKIRFGFSQYSELRSIKIELKKDGELLVLPNPVSAIVTIEFTNEFQDEFTFKLINSLGQISLYEEEIKVDRYLFDVSSLPNGQYFILLTSNKGHKFKTHLIVAK